MLHLRRCILTRLLSSPAASISPLHRLLSVAAPAVSPAPRFAIDEYLVDTCGLTRAQAFTAAAKLLHLKSPNKPDAVLAFLADLGLSGADVAALVRKDPLFLCTGVDRTLRPNVVELTGLGLSHTEVARLVSLAPIQFRSRSIVSKLQYYLPLFGSSDKLLRSISYNSNLLRCSLEKRVKLNVAFLQECGIDARNIGKVSVRWILCTKPELVRKMAARTEAIGVPRGSGMFRQALQSISFLSEEKTAVKVDYLKNTFRWSDAEVGIAVCKYPVMLRMSNDTLQSKSEFLICEVGLEPDYIAHRPVILSYAWRAGSGPGTML
uniref:Uncharacterized protein n=2 Tax=Avena sativa TaxID=4498 RepID=A0ACD5Z3X7_AVESA